jgi:hypothetical protein
VEGCYSKTAEKIWTAGEKKLDARQRKNLDQLAGNNYSKSSKKVIIKKHLKHKLLQKAEPLRESFVPGHSAG